jgi:chemotaxis protein methyltransferase CheR
MRPEWARAEYGRIAALMTVTAGLKVDETRRADTEQAILRGMRAARISEPSAYLALLQRDQAAVESLSAELTVGETYLLRDAAQFDLIRHTILQDIAAVKAAPEPIRIWSAGCATGEEAYSLAIVAHQLGLLPRTHIVATDIARARLERARRGRYRAWSFRGVPAEVKRRYFTRHDDEYEVNPSLREHVEFRYLNLVEDAYPSLSTGVWGMQLILCRNVLIYLDAASVTKVASALVKSLAESGWLLLGAADPPIAALTPCAVEITSAGLAYRPASTREPAPARPLHARPLEPRATTTRRGSLTAAPTPNTPRTPMTARVRTDRLRSARAFANVVRSDVPANEDAAVTAVRTLANQGRLVEAERVCTSALERQGAYPELCYLHALLLAESGHHRAAARAARQALYLDPDLVVAHLALGSALARMGDVSAARRSFANAERLLTALDPAAIVPASDGEPAGRLLEIARMQLQLALPSTA